jgi:hypothetical protein
MSIHDDEQRFPISSNLQPVEHLLEGEGCEPLSFVELVLYATEYSEDEGEVRDLVDALFDCDRLSLTDLSEDQIPCA